MDSEILLTVLASIPLVIAAWALWVSWRAFRVSIKQAEIAERTRKSSIRPYVVAFTRSYPFHDGVYLMLANVGFGAARNVRARIVEGEEFKSVPQKLLRDWQPLKEPTSILRVNERLWTMLVYYPHFDHKDIKATKTTPVTIELTYQDIEGQEFGPEIFQLDLTPNEGAFAVRVTRREGREIIEQKDLRPDD